MTNHSFPLVSIVIPSYNHGAYVEDAIRSVFNQTYHNIQLIVIDDASTDDSVVKISSLLKEKEFLFLKNEHNLGLQQTLMKALNKVEGEYLSYFASDDMIMPQKIEILSNFLQQHDLDGVYASGFVLYPDGRKVPMDMLRVEQMFKNNTYLDHIYVNDSYGAMFQSGLFKTIALKDVDPIRRKFWSDDWAVTIKLLEKYKIGFLNEPTVIYRTHDGNAYKKYWNTFPGRIQVVSLLTPPLLRPKALSNLFLSQANYLQSDDIKFALKFYLSALVMEFNKVNLYSFIKVIISRLLFLLLSIFKSIRKYDVKKNSL